MAQWAMATTHFFLAQLVGETGKVYAFDIQAAALLATERRLREADVLTRVSLIQVGHENLAQYVPQNVAAAVFNFGYLPRGNHAITTLPETSLQAIQAALNLLKNQWIACFSSVSWTRNGQIRKPRHQSFCRAITAKYVSRIAL